MFISPKTQLLLTEKLWPMLGKVEVIDGLDLDPDFFDEMEVLESLPTRDEQKRLKMLIGEQPIASFFYDEVSRDILGKLVAEEGMQLSTMAGYGDLKVAAERLVSSLAGLPRIYTLTVEMPSALQVLFTGNRPELQLAEGVVLKMGAAIEGGRIPPIEMAKDQPAAAEYALKSTQVTTVLLMIQFDGFAASYGGTDSTERALLTAQAFIGSLVAHSILRVRPQRLAPDERSPRFEVRAVGDAADMPVEHSNLPEPFALAGRGRAGSFLRKRLQSAGGLDELRLHVRRMGSIFAKREGELVHGNLVLGCKWFLDSYLGTDQVMGYVQAAVALESLLGEKAESNLVGIGALLSNRCAYMLAESVDDRRRLMKEVKDVYDVRSKIVHAGQSRLAGEDHGNFVKLHRICGDVIRHETNLVARTMQPPGRWK